MGAATANGVDQILEQWRRLFLHPEQNYHEQMPDGAMPERQGLLSEAELRLHAEGRKTVVLRMINANGLVRFGALDFDVDNVAAWNAILRACDLSRLVGMPAPIVTASGGKGFHLIYPFEELAPAGKVRELLALVKAATCGGLPDEKVELRPDHERDDKSAKGNLRLSPAFHQSRKRWGKILELLDRLPHPSSYDKAADLSAQADLLAKATPATLRQLDAAISDLRSRGHVVNIRQHTEASIEPRLDKLAAGEHPPCISSLVEKGVPEGMQFNTGNLNLASYCAARGLPMKEADDLAVKMATHSNDHSTAKRTVGEKIQNFRSNRQPAPFRCDYARNTRPWSAQFGGTFGCEACPARPEEALRGKSALDATKTAADAFLGSTHENDPPPAKPSPEPSEAPFGDALLPEPVTLDLVAYAWAKRQGLPNLSRVWPSDAAAAAATVAGGSSTRAAYFAEAARRAEIRAEKTRQSFTPAAAQMAERVAQAFLSRLELRVAEFRDDPSGADAAFKAALEMAEGLEGRARLREEISVASGLPLSTPTAVVASQLVKAASSIMTSTAKGGPLIKQRDKLIADLRNVECPTVPLPFPGLAAILHGGFRAGLLYCLIAPPKAGKTTFSSVLMDHAARAGNPVLYVGFEMGVGQMINAALARKTRINSYKIDTRSLSDAEKIYVERALDEYLADEGRLLELWEAGLTTTLADAQAWAVRAKQDHADKVPLIVVDYLQLARLGIREIDAHQSETRRVSAIAVACKDLARATGAAVLALSSVTKSAEQAATQGGELDVTAARDSLAIIHAADGVLALQSADVLVTRGGKKGDDPEEELVTPWQYAAEKAKKRQDPNATEYARAFERAARDYPRDRIRNAHARVDVLRHRGRTGSSYLYYRKALHDMIEVDLYSGIDGADEASPVDNEILAVEEMITGHAIEPVKPSQAATVNFRLITTTEDLEDALGWMRAANGETVAIDFETTGLDPKRARPRLLSVAFYDGTPCVIDLDAIEGGLQAVTPYLTGGARLVAHNAVFEMKFISEHSGIDLTDLSIDCTMIGAHVAGLEKGLSLREVAKHFLMRDLDKTAQASDWSAPELTPEQLDYAAQDAAILLDLWPEIENEIRRRESLGAYTLVKDAQPAIAAMELAGVPFDAATHKDLVSKMETERDALLATLTKALGGRKPSGNDLLAYFEEQLGGEGSAAYAAWPRTGTGKISTSEDVVTTNADLLPPEARKIVREIYLPFKTIEKRLTAFGKTLAGFISPATSRIHPSFRLTGTVTGRLSCSSPNLQQVPRDAGYRGLFRAPAGRSLVIADFNAMELRVAAQIAGEKQLLEAFNEGRDPHKLTASLLLGKPVDEITKAERQLAKAVNFGLLYGQGAKGLAAYARASYGVTMSEEDAAKHREAWFKAYPAFRGWHSTMRRSAERTLEVRTPGGRLRRWETADRNTPGAFKSTEAYNTPVQGGAAEAMLAAMARLMDLLKGSGLPAYPLATVHDELIVEAPETDADQVKDLLETAMRDGFLQIFPGAPTTGLVEAHVAQSWADK